MKTVLLTGASKGIGNAIHKVLSQNYHLLTPTSDMLNLDDPTSIKRYVKDLPPIDILINNAGVNFIRPIDEIREEEISNIMNVNLLGPLRLTQSLVPSMKGRNGKIVNISSIWGVRSKEYRTLYSMTKFGLIGQTKALARELAKFNILVNAVCPGFTDTELTRASLTPSDLEAIVKEIPLGRMATPDEIANLVSFLVSDLNTYVTGQAFVIDGGFLA